MSSIKKQKNVIIDCNLIKNELVIGLFLNIIKEKDLDSIIQKKIIENAKEDRHNTVDMLAIIKNMEEPIDFLKQEIFNEIKILNNFKKEKLLHNFEIKILYDNYLSKKESNIITAEQFVKLYELFNPKSKHVNHNQIVIKKDFDSNEMEITDHCGKCSEMNCGCKSIKITKNITFKTNKERDIMLKLEKPVLGNTHILYLSKDEYYIGFIHNKIYKHGFYKEVHSKCKCCKQLTMNGDLYLDYKTNLYEPDGYCKLNHLDEKGQIKSSEEGEFLQGQFISYCGDITKNCANCNKRKPNVVCFKCKKYLCLECDRKIHEPIMKKNKILDHKRNFFDNDIVFKNARYNIELRTFIIKEKSKYFKVKYNTKSKSIDLKQKTAFNPEILYFKKDKEYDIFNKIVLLLKDYTNGMTLPFEEIKEIVKSINFKIQLDAIVQ